MKIKEHKNIIKSIRKNIGNHSITIKDIIRTIILYYKRRKFKRFKNTFNTRRKFNNKRKFIRKPYKEKISECKCWNCNEKGHYANKCPKLKEKGIKYINTSQFIMNLEHIKENSDKWHEYEDFYISQTDNEDESESENSSSES